MDDEKTTATVSDFYHDVGISCYFKTNVNEHDQTNLYRDLISRVHPEVMKRYYGSGIAIPENIEGKKILDIGCGTGSLVYILSKLVGPKGHVVGIDVTESLIDICEQYSDYHQEIFGLEKKNFEFHVANAERLSDVGITDNTFDVIVSNGVFCLCPNKAKIFAEAYRVLKVGGELFLSDVYATQPPPEECIGEPKLWCLGLSCSQVWKQLSDSACEAGFTAPHLVFASPVNVTEEYTKKMCGASYCCAGNRMFKLPRGCQVTYKGTIKGHEDEFRWDINLTFKKGQHTLIDTELARVLKSSRFARDFDFMDSLFEVTSQREQNPFSYIQDKAEKGTPIPFAYTVE